MTQRWAKCLLVGTTGLTLAACEQLEETFPFLSNDDAAGASAPGLDLSADTESRDVEAPEVFQKTEAGLWDGRPSLGGVWVAHPDVTDPERVIIRNQDNGRFVVGALFRRERDNPGPSLQVSSDAAEELGMLAGSPANLDVVALRREEAAVAPPATTDFGASVGDDAALALPAPATIDATPLEPTLAPAAPVATPTVTSSATVDAIAGAAAAVAAAEAAAAPAVTLPDPIAPISQAPLGAPLDARAPLAAPATAPLPPPAAASTTSALEKPFIQIGIFSLEANANETADKLRADGMSASVLQQDSQGTTFWRVLVGPAPNAQDRTAILAKVQALGFSDAYFVTN